MAPAAARKPTGGKEWVQDPKTGWWSAIPPTVQGKPPLPPPPTKEAADYLRALSLKQPFCSALVLGKRRQESRTWKIKLPHDGTGLWVAAHSPAKAAPAGDPGMPQLRQMCHSMLTVALSSRATVPQQAAWVP